MASWPAPLRLIAPSNWNRGVISLGASPCQFWPNFGIPRENIVQIMALEDFDLNDIWKWGV